MKKKLLFSGLAIFAFILISGVFVKVYSGHDLYGKCDAGPTPCTALCPGCKEAFYPVPDRMGEGELTKGQCPRCGYNVGENGTLH